MVQPPPLTRFCTVRFGTPDLPPPAWPSGPHQAVLRALTLAGLPAGDQILALESHGAAPMELAWLVTVAAPALIPGWKNLPFLSRLAALTRWTQQHLSSTNEVVPHLLRRDTAPEEALREDPTLPDRVGLIPRWLEPFLRVPRSLVFRPGAIQTAADLGRWFEGEVLDLVVEGPQAPFQLPEGLRIAERLHLRGVPGLRHLDVGEFVGMSTELEVEGCPDLERIKAGSGLNWLRLRDCPRFEHLQLESVAIHRLEIDGCPGLRTLDLPATPALWYAPDLVLRNCPDLEVLRLEPGRTLQVRDLTVDRCPSLTQLPPGLTVERKLKTPGPLKPMQTHEGFLPLVAE